MNQKTFNAEAQRRRGVRETYRMDTLSSLRLCVSFPLSAVADVRSLMGTEERI